MYFAYVNTVGGTLLEDPVWEYDGATYSVAS